MQIVDSIPKRLRDVQEFQSAVVRMGVWVFMVTFIGVAGYTGYYDVHWLAYGVAFGLHLVWYLAILAHVVKDPSPSVVRRYIALLGDLSGTSFCILLGGEPLTPFYLFYIWIFISQGTRYGKNHLVAASLGSLVAYSSVQTILDGWSENGLESLFLLLILLVLPLYLYSLIHKLHDALQAAEEANQARGRFLATVTHELKNPLSSIVGNNDLIKNTSLDLTQQDYVDSIDGSATQLQALIGDILDLSRIDAGRLQLDLVQFRVDEEIAAVCRSLVDIAISKNLELVVDAGPELAVPVLGDKLRFRQILFNLVGNALKFTRVGRVVIKTRVEGFGNNSRSWLHIEIMDTGIGIPARELGKIFEAFWQADASVSREFGGTGLGTTIARDLVQLMGGEIGAESEENKGSRFWFKVPLAYANSKPVPQPAPARLKDQRVLILDADESSATVFEKACKSAGMKVVVIAGISDFDRVNHGGMTQLDADLVILSDSPRGKTLEDEVLLLRQLLRREIPVLMVSYRHGFSRRAIAPNTLSLQKPLTNLQLWQGLEILLGQGQISASGEVGQAMASSKVLVIEDDQINARLIESLLSQKGYDVSVVMDGAVALDIALDQEFDIALVDLELPGVGGIEFTRRYREQASRRRDLPIIALTSSADTASRRAAREAGMNKYLVKPVPPDLLYETVSEFVGIY